MAAPGKQKEKKENAIVICLNSKKKRKKSDEQKSVYKYRLQCSIVLNFLYKYFDTWMRS